MEKSFLNHPDKKIFTIFLAICLLGSCVDFYDIAQGTGNWIGEFAFTWALVFAGYCLLSLAFFGGMISIIWHEKNYKYLAGHIVSARNYLGRFRWFFAGLFFLFPIWLLQFTVWGIVFQGFFIRLLIWILSLLIISLSITEGNVLIEWKVLLSALVLTGGAYAIAASLRFVSGYPFSLGWSEGNRLWDYSIMFGRNRYDYPPDQEIFVLLEKGRQFVGGIPFLIPGITIKTVRIWVGLLDIFPYLLLGFALFRSAAKERLLWIILSLWTYLFLKQGPINSTLIISALLVVMAWRSSLLISIPLILLAGYFTNISRFTWIFAPSIWIAMLELSDSTLKRDGQIQRDRWIRVITLFGFGLIGGVLLPELIKLLQAGALAGISLGGLIQTSKVSPVYLQDAISRAPLLWYRLLPNSTFGPGILVGLSIATGSLVFLLYHLVRQKYWLINVWQKLIVTLPLLAFLAVGLVVSAKIGGGGDLHNMDMFFISLIFSTAVAWRHGGRQWLDGTDKGPIWLKMVIVAALMIPALAPLQAMRSYGFGEKTSWLVALTDAPNERALDMYPAPRVIDASLRAIQSEIDDSVRSGQILFIDQRQLLTFGFITGTPLVPDYDKKVLMERALTSNYKYFEHFYADLETKRFSLIITQPLNSPKKGSDDQFGEENNAWVKWVADPLLCYYAISQTLPDVNVQLLIPRTDIQDCSKGFP